MFDVHFDFERLLHPSEPALFFKQYWGKQPLILLRNTTNYYAEDSQGTCCIFLGLCASSTSSRVFLPPSDDQHLCLHLGKF